jgi:DNA-binding SARP family transcriptional activator
MPVNSGLSASKRSNSLRLMVLGSLGVSRNADLLADDAVQRRHVALLAVLSVHWKTGISREKLATLLWPSSGEAHARNSLKQALHILRRALGPNHVLGTTQLHLPFPPLTCDLVEFEQRLASNQLEEAVDGYGGAFVEGFHLGRDAEQFERWVDRERARLARCHMEAIETLAMRAAAAGNQRSALRWWCRLVELAPLETRFTEEAATTMLTIGDLSGALRLLESHRVELDRELSLPLGARLSRLIATIRLAQRS